MSVTLPSPPIVGFVPRYVSYGNDLNAPGGGATQRIIRLGDRWAADVTLMPLDRPSAEVWLSRLSQASRTSAVMEWAIPEGGYGLPGLPNVNGAGQTGSTLNLKGVTAGYAFYEAQFFSAVVSGRRYLHQVTAGVTAEGDGTVAVPIQPLLRASPADGALIEAVQPYIEGLVTGVNYSVSGAGFTSIRFTITEQR